MSFPQRLANGPELTHTKGIFERTMSRREEGRLSRTPQDPGQGKVISQQSWWASVTETTRPPRIQKGLTSLRPEESSASAPADRFLLKTIVPGGLSTPTKWQHLGQSRKSPLTAAPQPRQFKKSWFTCTSFSIAIRCNLGQGGTGGVAHRPPLRV